MSDARRIRWLRAVVAVAFIAGLLLCPRLWLPGRVYPEAPVWDGVPGLPAWLQMALYVALLVALAWVTLTPRPRRAIVATVGVAIILALGDQCRWQPWCYQYLCMLLALYLGAETGIAEGGGVPEIGNATEIHELRRSTALDVCRLIVVGTYAWSGLQKFNVNFADDVFPWLAEPMWPSTWNAPGVSAALFAAMAETAIGLGLLVPATRNSAVIGSALMHGLIMLSIGPLGHDWNTVVWPWNLAMPVITALLFWRAHRIAPFALGRCRPLSSTLPRWTAVVLFLVLPGLNLFGWWDAYLSAALYSGTTPYARLEFSPDAYRRLPASIQGEADRASGGCWEVDLRWWSMNSLNVPAYPADRVFRAIARRMRDQVGGAMDDDVVLVLHGRPHWRTGERMIIREPGPESEQAP